MKHFNHSILFILLIAISLNAYDNSYAPKSYDDPFTAYVVTSKNGLNLREEPGIDEKILIALKYGSIVYRWHGSRVAAKIDGKEGFWIRVKYGAQIGWIFNQHVKPLNNINLIRGKLFNLERNRHGYSLAISNQYYYLLNYNSEGYGKDTSDFYKFLRFDECISSLLFEVDRYEMGTVFDLFDINKKRTLSFKSIPKISPNKRFFFAFPNDSLGPKGKIAIYEINKMTFVFKQEFEIPDVFGKDQIYDAFAFWISNNTIGINIVTYAKTPKLIKRIRIVMKNDLWIIFR